MKRNIKILEQLLRNFKIFFSNFLGNFKHLFLTIWSILWIYAFACVAVIPSENNKRKTSVFVLLMLRAYFFSYAYLLRKTGLKGVFRPS